MRHTFLVVTVKKWLKLVYIYGSYRRIKQLSLLDYYVVSRLEPANDDDGDDNVVTRL